MRGFRLYETRRSRVLRADPTAAEAKLWSKLRNRRLDGHKFVRQVPIGPYFVDFLCREARLVVEVDGATHSTDAELARDARRTKALEAEGYRVVRVNNADVFEHIEGVQELILAELKAASVPTHPAPHPNLSRKRGEGVRRRSRQSRERRRGPAQAERLGRGLPLPACGERVG